MAQAKGLPPIYTDERRLERFGQWYRPSQSERNAGIHHFVQDDKP